MNEGQAWLAEQQEWVSAGMRERQEQLGLRLLEAEQAAEDALKELRRLRRSFAKERAPYSHRRMSASI